MDTEIVKNNAIITPRIRLLMYRLGIVCKWVFIVLLFLTIGQILVLILKRADGNIAFANGDALYDYVVQAGIAGVFYLVTRAVGFPKETFLSIDYKKSFKDNFEVVFLALLFLWVIISTFTAYDTDLAIQGNWYRKEGLLVYLRYAVLFLCALCVKRDGIKKQMYNLFIFGSVLLAVLVLINAFSKDIKFLDDGRLMWTGSFMNANHYGYFLTISIFVSIAMFFACEKKWWEYLYLAAAAINIVVMFYNYSIGALITAMISIPLTIATFWLSKRKFTYKYVVVIVMFIVLCLCFMDLPIFKKLVNFNYSLSSAGDASTEAQNSIGSGRLGLWRDASKHIKAHPIFGIGLENYLVDYSIPTSMDRPHNEYIQLMLFCGIPAMLFYVAFLVTVYVKAIIKRKELSDMRLVAISVVTAYCISAFVGNTMPYTTTYFVMFLAFAWAPRLIRR